MSTSGVRVTRLLRSRSVRMVSILALGALLLAATWIGAMQKADGLVLTVHAAKDTFDRSPDIVYSRVITNASQVQAIQALVNSVPRHNPLENVSCEVGSIHPILSYEFRFTWHGIPIERATVDTTGCASWSIRTLGVPNFFTRFHVSYALWDNLHSATGMPIPSRWE
jgi:hypothetical protein